MKQLLLLFVALSFAIPTFAIDASISFARFKTTEKQYVEIYLHIAGETVTYIPNGDAFQANVEVLLLFKQAGEIVQFDKYNLNSPLVVERLDFVDMKRFGLKAGAYDLEVEIMDKNKAENIAKYSTTITIETTLAQSDIQLLANAKRATENTHPFAKHGFVLEPLPYNFYEKKAERMWFYNELYSDATQKGQVLVVNYFLERIENNTTKTVQLKSKRKKAGELVPLLLGMDIKKLPSGNYNLVVEVRDSLEQLQSKKTIFFQRSNPYLNIENEPVTDAILEERDVFVNELSIGQLHYSLRALLPKMELGESDRLGTVIEGRDTSAKRLFLLNYWLEENPNLPEKAFYAYMEVVRAVDNTFKSGFRNGFETDRGNIYLKYGRPDDMINVVDDPSAPPYEIWSYNDFPNTNQTNVRFLFYNPTLAGGDYILLHSTARGEINNSRWEVELYKDAPNEIQGNDPFGATQMGDNVGRRAREYFTDF